MTEQSLPAQAGRQNIEKQPYKKRFLVKNLTPISLLTSDIPLAQTSSLLLRFTQLELLIHILLRKMKGGSLRVTFIQLCPSSSG